MSVASRMGLRHGPQLDVALHDNRASRNVRAAVFRQHNADIPLVADVALLARTVRTERSGQRANKVARRNVGEVTVRRGVRLLHFWTEVTGAGDSAGVDDQ